MNLEHIAGLHLHLTDVPQLFHRAIAAQHAVEAHLPRLAARVWGPLVDGAERVAKL